MNNSKQAPHSNPPGRHEKTANSLARHVIFLAAKDDKNLQSWVQLEVSELHQVSEHNVGLWTGRAEIVVSQGIRIDDSSIVVPFPPLSIAFQKDISLLLSMKQTTYSLFFVNRHSELLFSFNIEHTSINGGSYYSFFLKPQWGRKGDTISCRHQDITNALNRLTWDTLFHYLWSWENTLKVVVNHTRR